MTYQQHITSACSHVNDLSTFDKWVIVGEWTPAATDCGMFCQLSRAFGILTFILQLHT